MAVYKTPKSDPKRENIIQAAILKAAEVPLEVAQFSLRVAELALITAKHGNKNAITDAGAGANLAKAALVSAGYNVRINLKSLNDSKKLKSLLAEIEELEKNGMEVGNQIQEIMTERGKIF